jgi:hypothetical protein
MKYENILYNKNISFTDDAIEIFFTQQDYIRPRKNKTLSFFSYEKSDELLLTYLKTKFKVELYFYTLDVAINYFGERFQQMHNHCDNFKFLYDISKIKNITKDNIMKNFMDI